MEPQNAIQSAIADGEGKLARLGVQVDAMQAVLVRLLQDVVKAEAQLERGQAEQLVAVNERLVVAAMSSQADAEIAMLALSESAPENTLDPLTKLANRAAFARRALDLSAHVQQQGGRFALLFIDLDNFKTLNDTHGHGFGDLVLETVARRMQATVRQADIVSRHGGDEFLVLLPELVRIRDAQAVAEKLIAAVAEPMTVQDQQVRISASVGIAIYPDDAEDFETLVARADAAMYKAKRLQAGSHAFHAAIPDAADGAHAAIDRAPAPPRESTAGARAPNVPHRPSLPDTEDRHEILRLANEKLVLAALSARELQAAAERTRAQQSAFIAAVAEELRDPRAPIRIVSAMLGRQTDDEELLPRVQGLLDAQMTNISRLLSRLAEAAEGEPGTVPIHPEDMDLSRVIADAVAAARPRMEARKQTCDMQLPSGELRLWGDAGCLLQIISNLIDNASRNTHEGGRIRLSVEPGPESLSLTVADNGIGLAASMLSRVFDPFVQDIQALGLHGIGAGIGLTAARTLAQAHGGQLTAHSDGPGRGSRFVLTLPLSRRLHP
jgi:diguanylate cyclase (GGDEF)-like protein